MATDSTYRNANLKPKRARKRPIEILPHPRRKDDIPRMRQARRHIRHNRDEHMLLLRELARIQLKTCTKDREFAHGQPSLPGFAYWKRQELHNRSIKSDCRLADGEELVDEAQQHDKHEADCPRADRASRRGSVVLVAHDSPHFGVGRVVGEKADLRLDVGDELCMYIGVIEKISVIDKGLKADN